MEGGSAPALDTDVTAQSKARAWHFSTRLKQQTRLPAACDSASACSVLERLRTSAVASPLLDKQSTSAWLGYLGGYLCAVSKEDTLVDLISYLALAPAVLAGTRRRAIGYAPAAQLNGHKVGLRFPRVWEGNQPEASAIIVCEKVFTKYCL